MYQPDRGVVQPGARATPPERHETVHDSIADEAEETDGCRSESHHGLPTFYSVPDARLYSGRAVAKYCTARR